MFTDVTAKAIVTVTILMLAAGQAALLPSPALDAQDVTQSEERVFVKGDRLPLLQKGAGCSLQDWPHYEQRCQFNTQMLADQAPIRIIAMR